MRAFMKRMFLLTGLLYLQSICQFYVERSNHLPECGTVIQFANSQSDQMLLLENHTCSITGRRLPGLKNWAWSQILNCYVSWKRKLLHMVCFCFCSSCIY